MIAHGNSMMLKERLFTMSDPFDIYICSDCGCISTSQIECGTCKGDTTRLHIPYATKLLFQELMAMGIKIPIKAVK